MCYSAMIRQSTKEYSLTFEIRQPIDREEVWEQRVFPHREFPVVLEEGGQRTVKWMNYSLIPKWSKERKPKFATYNARIETICEKATWKTPILNQRCLVGLTSFFESCYEGTHAGNIVEFRTKNEKILAAAGVYEQWVDKATGEVVDSFAIITTKPSPLIKEVGHDRSPVFVKKEFFSHWLNSEKLSCSRAKELLLESELTPAFDVKVERPLKTGWKKHSRNQPLK